MRKSAAEHKKKLEKTRFFGHFSDFFRFWTFLKSAKKRVNGPKKTSISAFFHVFQKMKAFVVWKFYFLKTLVFLKSILDRFVSAGRCSRVILTFPNSESKQVTIPLVFFDPVFIRQVYAVGSFYLSIFRQQTDNNSARFF